MYLNIFKRSYYSSLQKSEGEHTIQAQRGEIIDNRGRLLATSLRMYNITMDPLTEYLSPKDTFYKYLDTLSVGLSRVLGTKSAQEFRSIIEGARKSNNRNVSIVKNINYLQYLQLCRIPPFHLGRNRGGIKYTTFEDIQLFHGNLGRRIIGFKNTTNKFFGIEAKMNGALDGKPGVEWAQNLGQHHYSSLYVIKEPTRGDDITTTIDINMQDIVDKALRQQLEELHAFFGVAILMEVNTGEVRALANLQLLSDSSGYAEINNMGVKSIYAPGSVMKLASMMIAFEKDPGLSPEKLIKTGNGIWEIGDFTIRDYKTGGFGTISLQKVFELSSNIGTAKIIHQLFDRDPQDFINRLSEINFDHSLELGIDKDNELETVIIKPQNKDKWSKVSLRQISYGYELQLTPMHIITFYNAIANNGKMIKPLFVKNRLQMDKPIETFKSEVINAKVCSDRTLKYCKNMLKGVVERGTGLNYVKSNIVNIAGKSGTTNMYINGRYDPSQVNATFVGYFPVEKPKYTCLVWISKPQTHKSGAAAAGPVLKKIAETIYSFDYDLHNKQFIVNNMPMEKSLPQVSKGFVGFTTKIFDIIDIKYSATKATWGKSKLSGDKIIIQAMPLKSKIMPNVIGMNARDAVFLLENYKLEIKIIGLGRVKKQSIASGESIKENQQITLNLG